MVVYDFIEIGTSDHDTEISKNDNKCGISIEPIKYYLDRLPCKKDCIKLNKAISNYTGKCLVYYLSEDTLHRYKFPYWVRGCNSIHTYHPTVMALCKDRNIRIEDVSEKDEIDVDTLYTTMTTMNVEGIYFLKIDTEGHDTVILKQFFQDITHTKYLPHVIMFESNILTVHNEVEDTIKMLHEHGYECISRTEHDTTMKLNLHKRKHKHTFSSGFKNYYIIDYPPNYNPNNLPHANSLECAQEYCSRNNYSGVTLQNGRYEVRNGPHVYYHEDNANILMSWIHI